MRDSTGFLPLWRVVGDLEDLGWVGAGAREVREEGLERRKGDDSVGRKKSCLWCGGGGRDENSESG